MGSAKVNLQIGEEVCCLILGHPLSLHQDVLQCCQDIPCHSNIPADINVAIVPAQGLAQLLPNSLPKNILDVAQWRICVAQRLHVLLWAARRCR